MSLFSELTAVPEFGAILAGAGDSEAKLCRIIERLHERRSAIGEDAFSALDRRIRRALRELLDADLKIAGGAEN